MKKRRRIPIITKRVLTSVVLAGFLLCTLISFASHWTFTRQFRSQYDTNIRAIAEAARETLNPERFPDYLANPQADYEWKSIRHILQDFVDKFDLNLLYVSAVEPPDYTHITYLYNPVKNDGKWKEFPLGYSEVYTESNYNASAKHVFEEGATVVRHTLKTRSGSHITAMVPVFDSDGKVIAVLGAQKSIQEFVDARRTFLTRVLILEIAFAALFIALFSGYFNSRYIKPIMIITKETDRFASYGDNPSDRLLNIKNKDEVGILAHSLHQMEYDVCRNIEELTRVTAEKERISTELSVAAKIQLDMLPKGYPPFPERTDFDLFATMNPAKEVGGDLYDYLLLDDDHLMMVVGDVSGKGVPAALFMGKCKALLDFFAYLKLSPKEIFEKTNEQLCKGKESGLFVTCWLGIFTFSTGELRFVNAGHPYPVLYHAGAFSYLKTKPNFVLGGMEGLPYTEHSITLSKGDRIFVYTDGVTEATNASEVLYGDDRLLSAMETTQKMDAPATLKTVRESIDAFVGEAEQFDDITMLEFVWQEI